MIKINLFKIKKGKIKTWLNWCELLNTKYKKEAIKTLEQEGLSSEGFGIFELDGEHYTVGFSVGKHLPVEMNNELNKKHRETKKECLERIESIKIGYEFEIE